MASHTSRLNHRIALIGCSIFVTVSVIASTRSIAVELGALPSIQRVDEVMYFDPEFPDPKYSKDISNDAITLWLEALRRSDSQLQRVTIDTIAIAHQRGMAGIEAAVDPLVKLLGQPDLSDDVRRAAVKALIEFDAKDHADVLADQSTQYGSSIATVVEPALASWKFDGIADEWISRLDKPGVTHRSLINAISGLGAIEDQRASPRMFEIVNDRSFPPAVRMAAARAIGLIAPQGLVDQATALINLKEPDTLSDLLALALLEKQSDESSIELLRSLMNRESTVVQSETLNRFHEIDPALVLDYVDDSINSRDVNVRKVIASALIISREKNRIAPLATLLDDVNPSLRRHVADALVDLAQDGGLRAEVISEVSGILDQDAWRGCEQATVVLVNLDHKGAGDRFVDLMSHPRGEVMVTSAWGLRRFAMEKHLPAMLGRAEEVYRGFKKRQISLGTPGAELLMEQLFMAFGQMRYQPSQDLAKSYVPRNFSLGEKARAAAVWSLGYLNEGEAPEELVKMMLERLNDVLAPEPEFEDVRRMCAVSFGRMDAESALPDLRKFATILPTGSCRACHWAIEKMTGKKPPVFKDPAPLDYHDWFLKPIPVQTTSEATSTNP